MNTEYKALKADLAMHVRGDCSQASELAKRAYNAIIHLQSLVNTQVVELSEEDITDISDWVNRDRGDEQLVEKNLNLEKIYGSVDIKVE